VFDRVDESENVFFVARVVFVVEEVFQPTGESWQMKASAGWALASARQARNAARCCLISSGPM
jgi:hypothetical protein